MQYLRLLGSITLIGGVACGNVSGHLAATGIGDTSHPAERGSPLEALRAACGDGAMTALGATALTRQPYLQQVTASGALLGWVTNDAAGAKVTLSHPDGIVMASADGAIDSSTLRSATDKLMWSNLGDAMEPSSIYCYELANDRGSLADRTGFRTAPSATSTDPVRFLAFGDSGGGGADQYALLEQMYTVKYDLVLHTGDVAYDDGTIGQYEDNAFGVYADLFRNIPFFPAAGNHDYHTMSGAPFREVFNLPGTTGEKWYSYDWGQVHFVALDTESDYATQATWLDQDLAASDRPWKIVYLHKPPYSSGSHGSDVSLRNQLAPVLERRHVQLLLAGHDHDYERMKPQHGTYYIVTGGGGVGTHSVARSSFTAFAQDVIHFVYGEVGSDEMVLHAIDATGTEFDSVVIPR